MQKYWLQTKSFSKPRRRRRRERHQTKGLMSRTMAVHVRFELWYISLPFFAKQQREMTNFMYSYNFFLIGVQFTTGFDSSRVYAKFPPLVQLHTSLFWMSRHAPPKETFFGGSVAWHPKKGLRRTFDDFLQQTSASSMISVQNSMSSRTVCLSGSMFVLALLTFQLTINISF